MSSFQTTVGNMSQKLEQGALVFVQSAHDIIDLEGINNTPAAFQVHLFTIDTATGSAIYEILLNGTTISYTAAAGSPTKAEIVAGMIAEINETVVVSSVLVASLDPANTDKFFVTARESGVAFTASDSDVKISNSAVTANSAAEAIPFGMPVLDRGIGLNTRSKMSRYVSYASSAQFTAQVDSYAITYDAAKIITLEIEVEGLTYKVADAQATDAAATATALAALMSTKIGLTKVAVTASTSNIIITAATAGVTFTSDCYVNDPVAAVPVKTSNLSASTSLQRRFYGVSMRRNDFEATSDPNTGAQYDPNSFVQTCRKTPDNAIAVPVTASVADGDPVYIGVLTGGSTTRGVWYNSSAVGRVWLPGNVAKWVGYSADATLGGSLTGLGMLRLDASNSY